MTPLNHGPERKDARSGLDRRILPLAAAPWLAVVTATLSGAHVGVQLGALAVAVVATALASSLRAIAVPVRAHEAAPQAERTAAEGEAARADARAAALNRAVSSALGRGVVPATQAVNLDPDHEFATLAVLLVEDNEVNRKVATRMLQKLWCAADVAVNGLEGVERTAARHYDLVFMDCQMPEMDGFEATRAIRSREQDTDDHVRIVAMTANALEGDRERCIACGMDDYVAKPIKLDYLVEHLRMARDFRRAA